ncbi:MAG: sensor histidine kinase [Anaerovoracaceae bacterium]|jgi:two-component system phosphate regulon sensor histidine kinase PhoR
MKISRKIFAAILLTAIIVFAASVALFMGALYSHFTDVLQAQLKNQTVLAAQGVEDSGIKYLRGLRDATSRFTWIAADGKVLYDSETDAAKMANHKDREEVKEAMSDGYGESRRHSATLMVESLYSAKRLDDGSVLRLAINQHSALTLLLNMMGPIILIVVVALALALALGVRLSRRIVRPLNELDLEHPLANEEYDELAPLFKRIDMQQKELRSQQEELDRSEQIRREFTANVSHELKTPIQSISGYAELLANGLAKDEDKPEFYRRIYNESRRMSHLVEDIIALTHLDEGAAEVAWSETDVEAMTKEIINELSTSAQQARVRLLSYTEPLQFYTAPKLLRQIISNLCDNAIKYNRPGGMVEVSVKRTEGGISLRVHDTGIGISEEDQKRIFERFYRVDKSRSPQAEGTGLGLSIVKHAAIVLHAKIDLHSQPDIGTDVTVLIPDGRHLNADGERGEAENPPHEQ